MVSAKKHVAIVKKHPKKVRFAHLRRGEIKGKGLTLAVAPTSIRHLHVCTFGMEETKRYRQQSAKEIQGTDGYAFGTSEFQNEHQNQATMIWTQQVYEGFKNYKA
jgi:hypothetical protein